MHQDISEDISKQTSRDMHIPAHTREGVFILSCNSEPSLEAVLHYDAPPLPYHRKMLRDIREVMRLPTIKSRRL